MAFSNLNTFGGWQQESRSVRVGQKAVSYAELVDGRIHALFHLDQTEPCEQLDLASATLMTPAERAKIKQTGKAKHVKVRVTKEHDGQDRMAVWVGNNKEAIKLMRNSLFKYSGKEHRWIGVRPDAKTAVEAFEGFGYKVDLEAPVADDNPHKGMVI